MEHKMPWREIFTAIVSIIIVVTDQLNNKK